jgi:hypothetical protein
MFSSGTYTVGTHSVRKGAATYLLSLVDGPSAIQVYLRAGWTLGNVPDRYIYAGAGGDQLVGRSIALLPLQEAAFATLGPHFTQEGLNKISEFGWNRLIPGYDNYPDCFKSVIRVLLANIVFHHDSFLVKTLASNHPLFQSHMFSNHRSFLLSLIPYVVTGLRRNSITDVSATGIPGNLAITAALESLQERIKELEISSKKIADEMEKTMREGLADIPRALRDMLKEEFDGLGPKVLTQDALDKALSKFAQSIQDRIATEVSQIRALHATAAAASATVVGVGNGSTNLDEIVTMQHCWGGKFRYCCRNDCVHPQHKNNRSNPVHNFEFPVCSVKQLFRLWHCGNLTYQVGPYKKFVVQEHYDTLKELPAMQPTKLKNVGKAAKVMKVLEAIIMEQYQESGGVIDNFQIDKDNYDELFEKAFPVMYGVLYSNSKRGSNRKLEVAYTSLYNKLSSSGEAEVITGGTVAATEVVGTSTASAVVPATAAPAAAGVLLPSSTSPLVAGGTTNTAPTWPVANDYIMDLEF